VIVLHAASPSTCGAASAGASSGAPITPTTTIACAAGSSAIERTRQPGALSELDEIVEKQFAGAGRGGPTSLGGPKVAASILNMMEAGAENTVMEDMRKVDEGLVARIEDLMIVFDNLLGVDDRGMQELLRQVQSDSLLLALKGADEELKAKIFRNMSQRAAEMLKDDLEARGPVRLADVEAAQKEILAVARKMAGEGTLMLGGRGGQYV
jgi:flagellar motor switch protein FliG